MQTAWELGYRKEGICYSSINVCTFVWTVMRTKMRVKPLVLKQNCPILFGHSYYNFYICWKLQTVSSNVERLVNTCHSDCTSCGVCVCVCAHARARARSSDWGVIRPRRKMIEQGQKDNWREKAEVVKKTRYSATGKNSNKEDWSGQV
jgi:hypothetical protein